MAITAKGNPLFHASNAPNSTLEERVTSIVGEQLGVKQHEVGMPKMSVYCKKDGCSNARVIRLINSASFVEDLGADSLDTVELVMALEKVRFSAITNESSKLSCHSKGVRY